MSCGCSAPVATHSPSCVVNRACPAWRSLAGIRGDLRKSLGRIGKLEPALQTFRQAMSQTRALYEAGPRNSDYLLELGQAEFWVGYVACQRARTCHGALHLPQRPETAPVAGTFAGLWHHPDVIRSLLSAGRSFLGHIEACSVRIRQSWLHLRQSA